VEPKRSSPESEPLLRPTEVARRADVSVETVIRWSTQGRLRAIRIAPRTIRFDPSEVAALLGGDPPSDEVA
jgi:excisionase family DNA binding protein